MSLSKGIELRVPPDVQGGVWFAWHPVRTIDGLRWLRVVRRCIDMTGLMAGGIYYRDV
jgi:hypothetical protein